MTIDIKEVLAYNMGEELVCAECATKEEVEEWGQDAENLRTREAVQREEDNELKLYCGRCGGRIRA
jgi:hypothetical protein